MTLIGDSHLVVVLSRCGSWAGALYSTLSSFLPLLALIITSLFASRVAAFGAICVITRSLCGHTPDTGGVFLATPLWLVDRALNHSMEILVKLNFDCQSFLRHYLIPICVSTNLPMFLPNYLKVLTKGHVLLFLIVCQIHTPPHPGTSDTLDRRKSNCRTGDVISRPTVERSQSRVEPDMVVPLRRSPRVVKAPDRLDL